MYRRNQIEIIRDILDVCLHGSRTTRVVYKVNLNFQMFNRYYNFLKEKGLLAKEGKIINKNWFNYREGQPGTVTVFEPKNITSEDLRNQANILFVNWYMARNSAKRMVRNLRYGFYPFLFTALGPVLFA